MMKRSKTMKKFAALLTALMLLLSLSACAEEAPAAVNVYVSITDNTGALVLAYVPVSVTDTDEDGIVSIHDALVCAHAANHPDGADAFASAQTEYGISMTRLWGVENGGSYGYYLNDASAWSLMDPVQENDHVKAFAYTDLAAWSDAYCFFDTPHAEVLPGAEITLTLSVAGYDENWAPVTLPAADAMITVNGEAADTMTDAEGKCTLTFDEEGVYVISAKSETQNLVAPVCVVTVAAAQ